MRLLATVFLGLAIGMTGPAFADNWKITYPTKTKRIFYNKPWTPDRDFKDILKHLKKVHIWTRCHCKKPKRGGHWHPSHCRPDEHKWKCKPVSKW